MIEFSPLLQAFFNKALNYQTLPNDLVAVSKEQHVELLSKINAGYHIFADLKCSDVRPSVFHTWNGQGWQDQRTDEQKRAAFLASLKPLTRRQFKLALHENKLLVSIETAIAAIKDENTRLKVQIEYQESTEFQRTNKSVIAMCALLGLTDERVDKIWQYALTL